MKTMIDLVVRAVEERVVADGPINALIMLAPVLSLSKLASACPLVDPEMGRRTSISSMSAHGDLGEEQSAIPSACGISLGRYDDDDHSSQLPEDQARTIRLLSELSDVLLFTNMA